MSAASAPPLSVSLPPRPFRVTRSLAASGPAMLTCGSRPVTCTVAPDEAAVTTSVPAVPLTMTLSAATSPTPPTARSRFSAVTSVESRSLTVTESAPARAFRATVSTSCARVTTAPRLRVSRSSEPTADAAKTSAAAEPLNRSVSSSVPPWTMSLPSPGSQMKRSAPAPRMAVSAPALPSTVSVPVKPLRVSAKRPPISVSVPGPPLSVVRSVFVNAPFDSSIRRRSFPRPPFTTILREPAAEEVKFGLPLSPTSTTRRPPEAARSAIRSPGAPPVTVSVPRATEAVTAACASAASPRTAVRTAQSSSIRVVPEGRMALPQTQVPTV